MYTARTVKLGRVSLFAFPAGTGTGFRVSSLQISVAVVGAFTAGAARRTTETNFSSVQREYW